MISYALEQITGQVEEPMETLPRRGVSREEMMRRVARFADLVGFDGGLPDSRMPGSIRMLYNVIGFQPPPGAKGAVTSPVGDDASPPSRSRRGSTSATAAPSPAGGR